MDACKMSLALLVLVFIEVATSKPVSEQGLLSCLGKYGVKNYTASHSKFFDRLLKFSIQNLRYSEPNVLKPSLLILPQTKQEVQATVTCCRQEGFEIRVRSGGHSYAGTSYTAQAPFAIIDLINLNAVAVDVSSLTAWVEAGATLGETYYAISHATGGEYGFSAGSCPTVGTGGHISGGGFGLISRKYGLAADNVVDAEVVDAVGRVLNRKTMGEDLFWAIRGGGGGSWGVVVTWKINLLRVPQTVTVFSLSRRGLENVTDLVYKWQTVAPNLEKEFYLSVYLTAVDKTTINANFNAMYLGPRERLLKSMDSSFAELDVRAEDCKELTWIESVLFYSGVGPSVNNLRDRYDSNKLYFYAKSDYVRNSIPKSAIKRACQILQQEPKGSAQLDPYGGKMAEVMSDAIPYPHRAGNLFGIQYMVAWYDDNGKDAEYKGWLRKVYAYMEPYVSQNPRAAYVNYIDLDLGTMGELVKGTSVVRKAREWGRKYFIDNYERLVQVKTKFDPENVFRNLQSIPPNMSDWHI